MKTFYATLAIISLLAQPSSFGQATGQATGQTPGPLADSRALVITQASTDLQLENIEKTPIFETQQKPDTCYRDVQHGTRQQCDTLYHHDCNTTYQNECHNVPYPVCQNVQQNVCVPVYNQVCNNVPQQVCNNVPQQVCRNETRPVCQNVPRNQCDTVSQCTTVDDRVCHGNPQVCTTVPRRVCNPVTQCHSVPDQVCHTETTQQCSMENRQECHVENRQQCQTVTTQSCHVENQQQCHDEYRQQCANVPHESCTDTPYQSCQTVPNRVTEPYACTKPVQVQTGETVKNHVIAAVKVVLSNFGQLDISKEQLVLKLQGKDVGITLGQTSKKVIFRLVKKDQQVQAMSDIETRITTTFTLEAMSSDVQASLYKVKITNLMLGAQKLSFKLESIDAMRLPISIDGGYLNIAVHKDGGLYTVIDDNFAAKTAVLVGDHFEIALSSFQVDSLEDYAHYIDLEVNAKVTFNRAELLNPELLGNVNSTKIVTELDNLTPIK